MASGYRGFVFPKGWSAADPGVSSPDRQNLCQESSPLGRWYLHHGTCATGRPFFRSEKPGATHARLSAPLIREPALLSPSGTTGPRPSRVVGSPSLVILNSFSTHRAGQKCPVQYFLTVASVFSLCLVCRW